MKLEPTPQPRTEKIKNLCLLPEAPGTREADYFPHFYAEARIDFNDVRTGLRETLSLSKAMEIYSAGAEMLWTKDMVSDIDPRKLTAAVPDGARLTRLPDFVDANFISRMESYFVQFLLRSYVARIYRNPALNVYSSFGESQAEFSARCLELLGGSIGAEMDQLHDLFVRRLEQLKEKYLAFGESNGLELGGADSRNRDIFGHYADRIAGLFLRGGQSGQVFEVSHGMQELEERLAGLGVEAHNAIAKLASSYEEKARALDEYLLHPNLKEIHFVRSCILWMPKKAA